VAFDATVVLVIAHAASAAMFVVTFVVVHSAIPIAVFVAISSIAVTFVAFFPF